MKKVMLLLADGFEAYEASVFTDVFGWNEWEGNGQIQLVSVGLRKELSCTWGFKVIPDRILAEVDLAEYAALAIPGGFEEADFYEDAYDEVFLEVIRSFHQQQKPIASICVGALPIAKSGVLTGKKGTTYTFPSNQRRQQLQDMGVEVCYESSIVCDGEIITSASPATALDVAFLLLEKLSDQENVKAVKERMGF